MDNITDIQKRMSELERKWKDRKPIKLSNGWWRYRADQSLYLLLKSKLKTTVKLI